MSWSQCWLSRTRRYGCGVWHDRDGQKPKMRSTATSTCGQTNNLIISRRLYRPLHPDITIPCIISYRLYNRARGCQISVLRLLPGSPHSLDKVFGGYAFSAREITGRDLRVDFNTRVHRDQVFYTCTGTSAAPGQFYCIKREQRRRTR